MARTVDDISEIKRTVYGRDMRKPLADALVHIKNYYDEHGIQVEVLTNVVAFQIGTDDYSLMLSSSIIN